MTVALRRVEFLGAALAGVALAQPLRPKPAVAGGARSGDWCTHPKGNPHIDFSLALLDGGGARFLLSSLSGSSVWLTFFTTWCPPCNEEAAAIVDFGKRYRAAGLRIVGIDVKESPEKVRAFVGRYGMDYTVVLDPHATVFHGFGGNAFPTHIFLDRTGHITCVAHGALQSREMDNEIAVALASGAPLLQAKAAASPSSVAGSPAPAAATTHP